MPGPLFPTNQKITFAEDASVDAFWRLRVSEPRTIFDVKHLFDKQPIIYDEIAVSGGASTHLPNEGAVSLDVTSTIGSRICRQTKRYIPYQPGKSRLSFLTGNLAREGIVAGIRSRIGIFDDDNDKDTPTFPGGGDGHFFELDENGNMGVVERSFITDSQVDTRIEQTTWNVDKFDGTGPSQLMLDPTKAQVFVIDWSWLGAGAARLGFLIGRKVRIAHIFDHGNTGVTTYMSTATLPVRYELENISASAAGKMTQICETVQSEGGFNPRGKIFTADRGISSVAVTNAKLFPIISIRTKAANNRQTLNPIRLSLVTETPSAVVLWKAILGGTLTAASFNSVNVSSAAEFDIVATDIANGVEVASGYFTEKSNVVAVTGFENTLLPAADIAGVPDIVTIVAQREDSAAAVNVLGSIDFQEWD